MKEIFSVLLSKTNTEFSADGGRKIGIYGSGFFAIVAIILTFLNIFKGFWLMAGSTATLVIGFIFSSFLAYRNQISSSRIITSVLCAFVFSYYAFSGQNDGFAILWILLIPVIGPFLVELKMAFFLGLYFQIFLIVLFYTPVSGFVSMYYTDTFMMRFPILYFASFGATTFLACQLQVLYNALHKQAYYDDMTGLFNRRKYNEIRLKQLEKDSLGALAIVSLDLNRLKYVNDNIGHEAGDAMLIQAAKFIDEAFEGDVCSRTGGDEFIVISHRGKRRVENSIEKLQFLIRTQDNTNTAVTLSLGCAFSEDHPEMNFNELSILSDQEMYADKALYYSNKGIDRRH